MDPITVTLRPDQIELLAELSGDNGEYESKSEAMRAIIDEYDSLQSEVKELKTENERLRNERRAILSQRKENTELVEYVEDEQRYRQASLSTRIKWWFRGMD